MFSEMPLIWELASNAAYSEGVYAAAMDPNMGSILALLVSHDLETGEISADALGVHTNVFVPGSVARLAVRSHFRKSTLWSINRILFVSLLPSISGLRPMVHVLLQR